MFIENEETSPDGTEEKVKVHFQMILGLRVA